MNEMYHRISSNKKCRLFSTFVCTVYNYHSTLALNVHTSRWYEFYEIYLYSQRLKFSQLYGIKCWLQFAWLISFYVLKRKLKASVIRQLVYHVVRDTTQHAFITRQCTVQEHCFVTSSIFHVSFLCIYILALFFCDIFRSLQRILACYIAVAICILVVWYFVNSN